MKIMQAKTVDPPLVWRVKDTDLDSICPWVLPALKKKWPRLNEDGISYWFKSAIGDRSTLFARTQNVVGMFHVVRDILEPSPTVMEKFVRANDEATSDEKNLVYGMMKEWAISIKARECVIGLDSDSNMSGHVVPYLSTLATPLTKRQIYRLSLTE
jgi:hypothetical protein